MPTFGQLYLERQRRIVAEREKLEREDAAVREARLEQQKEQLRTFFAPSLRALEAGQGFKKPMVKAVIVKEVLHNGLRQLSLMESVTSAEQRNVWPFLVCVFFETFFTFFAQHTIRACPLYLVALFVTYDHIFVRRMETWCGRRKKTK